MSVQTTRERAPQTLAQPANRGAREMTTSRPSRIGHDPLFWMLTRDLLGRSTSILLAAEADGRSEAARRWVCRLADRVEPTPPGQGVSILGQDDLWYYHWCTIERVGVTKP